MRPAFTVYAIGVYYASVCTSLDDETATVRLNLEYPSGVGEWHVADEPFANGDPNGRPCNDTADHRHLLFVC